MKKKNPINDLKLDRAKRVSSYLLGNIDEVVKLELAEANGQRTEWTEHCGHLFRTSMPGGRPLVLSTVQWNNSHSNLHQHPLSSRFARGRFRNVISGRIHHTGTFVRHSVQMMCGGEEKQNAHATTQIRTPDGARIKVNS